MRTRLIIILAILITSGLAAAQEKGVNLYLCTRPGWSHPVVPRINGYSTPTTCWVDDVLWGNDFYLNAHGRNNGDTPTPGGFDVTFYLDGQYTTMGYAPVTTNEFAVLNQGPFDPDYCGRHTVSAYVDALHSIAETNEDDNTWGGQFLWPSRYLSSTSGATVYPAPPLQDGGWDHCPDPELEPNCDGYYFDLPMAEWVAVSVRPLTQDSQYDIFLYDYNEDSSTFGFTNALEADGGLTGELSAMIVHQPYHAYPATTYNLAVINDGGNADYRIQGHQPQTLLHDVNFYEEFGPDQELGLWTFSLSPEEQGQKNILLVGDPQYSVRVGHIGSDYGYWDTSHYPGGGFPTNAWGEAFINVNITDNLQHAVVAFVGSNQISDTHQVRLKLIDALPNLLPSITLYWDHPITPTNYYSAPAALLPSTLWGDSTTTYLNYLQRNNSGADCGNFANILSLDGAPYPTILNFGGLDAFSTAKYQRTTPVSITGGRHTLSLMLDSGNSVEEVTESDNNYAAQYCWSPGRLPYGNVQTMPAPPLKDGGHNLAYPGVEMLDNCSSLRLAVEDPSGGDNWWRGMAVIPDAACDVDVKLFEQYTNSTESFATPLISSESETGLTDFVLVNMNQEPDHDVAFDAGFTRESGTGSFLAQALKSQFVASNPTGWYGGWVMIGGDIMQVKEFRLEPGLLAIKLDNTSGNGILGLTLFDTEARNVSLTSEEGKIAQSIAGGNGQDVTFTVQIPQTGYYSLAVWKRGADDLQKSINYRLCLYPGVTPVEEPPVSGTFLGEARPNPFNPCTTLSFTQAKAGHTRIALYDVRGLLVKVLCDEEFPAGRHEVIWQGVGEDGRHASSGVYVARMQCSGKVYSRRLTLVR